MRRSGIYGRYSFQGDQSQAAYCGERFCVGGTTADGFTRNTWEALKRLNTVGRHADAGETLLSHSHWPAITLIHTLQPDTTLQVLSMVRNNGLWTEKIFLDRHLSNSHKIFVFRCGASALYALTADSTGRNLPSAACPAGWRFEQSITLHFDNSSSNHELMEVTRAAIAKHGFYLTHAAIQGLPVLTAHDRAKSIKSAGLLAQS
jgi:hypothetical protein